jgi:predicted small lipoprotein YifL
MVAAASVLALAGCGESAPTESPPADVNAQLDRIIAATERISDWRPAPENSFFGVRNDEMGNGGYFRYSVRCWRRASGFDCFKVSSFGTGVGSGTFEFRRYLARSLEQSEPGPGGYECGYVTDWRNLEETIDSDSGPLISRSRILNSGDPTWNRAFVEGYMREHGVGEGSYFDCPRLARIIATGGSAALGTTAVRYADIIGR